MKKKLSFLIPSIGEILFVAIFLTLLFPGNFDLLEDVDTGWHIRIGEFILNNFLIPTHDIFSYVTPPLPWTTPEWLLEVIMALLHRAFGLSGVVVFFAFFISLIYYLLFKMIRQYEGNILIDVLIILFVILSSMLHWHARPHIISLLLFVISYRILDNFEYKNENRLYFLPAIMLFWTNLHGGFIIGFVLISIYLFSNVIMYFISENKEKYQYKNKAKILGLTTIVCILISLLNPHGYNIFVYPFMVLSNQYLMDHLIEFLSPNFHELSAIPFKYLLLFVITITILGKRQLKLTEFLLVLLFTNMALYSVRNITLFGIVVAPILSRHCNFLSIRLSRKLINFLQSKSEGITAINASAKGYLWVIALLLVIAALLTGRLDQRFNEEKKPVAAVEFIKKEPLKGNMFNEYAFGGYIVYSAYPQYKVFIHGKIDWHGEEKVKEYYEISSFKPGWEDLIEKYNINWIIFNTDSALSRFLKERNDWKLIYADKVASIFVRNVPEYFEIIKKYRQPLSPAS
jgi:hypothetical protein